MNEPIELDVHECRELLGREVFGRLAFTTDAGPRIVPLNYAVLDEALVFRTTPYSELARQAVDQEVAFEIDDIDRRRHLGWSVVALGRVDAPGQRELGDLRADWAPEPWAGGHRQLILRLRWRELSGRRIVSSSGS